MKFLIVTISVLSVVSVVIFTGAFQACTNESSTNIAESVDSTITEDDVVLVTDTILVVPQDVLEEVKAEELDIADVEVIEFTEEDTSDMFE